MDGQRRDSSRIEGSWSQRRSHEVPLQELHVAVPDGRRLEGRSARVVDLDPDDLVVIGETVGEESDEAAAARGHVQDSATADVTKDAASVGRRVTHALALRRGTHPT